MMTTYNPILIISGNLDIGLSCCGTVNGNHKPAFTLYKCQNPECDHYVCAEHRQPCSYCEGCCAEKHGLGSHQTEKKR
jgi:hypothetical protein